MTSQSHLLIPPPCCCCSSHVYPPPSFVGARRHLHIWRRRHSGFPWFPLPRRRRPPPSLLQPAYPPSWAGLAGCRTSHSSLQICRSQLLNTSSSELARQRPFRQVRPSLPLLYSLLRSTSRCLHRASRAHNGRSPRRCPAPSPVIAASTCTLHHCTIVIIIFFPSTSSGPFKAAFEPQPFAVRSPRSSF